MYLGMVFLMGVVSSLLVEGRLKNSDFFTGFIWLMLRGLMINTHYPKYFSYPSSLPLFPPIKSKLFPLSPTFSPLFFFCTITFFPPSSSYSPMGSVSASPFLFVLLLFSDSSFHMSIIVAIMENKEEG